MGLTQGEKAEGEWFLDPITICPTQNHLTDINLWLKSSETETSLAEIFTYLGGGYLELLPYRSTPSLEEATGMNLDTFYHTYLDPNTDTCLQVPAALGDVYS